MKLSNNMIVLGAVLTVAGIMVLLGRIIGHSAAEKEAIQAGVGEYYTVYTTNSEQVFRWKVPNK